MIEAVGEPHWPVYFRTLYDRLKPGGIAAIQGITISEANYETYRSSVDFIQRYIFPGGMLLTKTIMKEQAAKAGLILERVETFGQSYATTLRLWHERFEAVWPEVAKLGFDEKFRRLWKLYLAYCEAGFAESVVDVGIYKLRKPLVPSHHGRLDTAISVTQKMPASSAGKMRCELNPRNGCNRRPKVL